MFRKEIELNGIQLIELYKGSKTIANTMFVKPVPAFRMNHNAGAIENAVRELEQTRLLMVKEAAAKDENGEPLIVAGEYVFSSVEEKAEIEQKVKELVSEVQSFKLWHFEVGEIANDNANISGAVWKQVEPVIVDSAG